MTQINHPAPRLAALLLAGVTAFGADQVLPPIDRLGIGDVPPIPIALSGYTGEVAQVLEFDLEVVGFKVVPESTSGLQYILSGKNDGRVEGTLRDAVSKQSRLHKAYGGTSLRQQAHGLADDVVKEVLGLPGIARTRIAFKRDLGRRSELYISDYDGYGAAAITSDGSVVAAPCWAPGKNLLVYTTYLAGNPDIMSHDLSTGKRAYVARYSGSNISPAVSPDGGRVAMIMSKGGSPDLYVADIDGSNLRQLTKTPEDESSPCWSPDGRTICFSTRIGGRRTLATIPVAGGAVKRLNTSGAVNPSEPAWSPDGKWIAFTSQRRDFEICVVPAAGGTARTVAVGEDPSWSPNSRTLVMVQRDKQANRTLSVLDVLTKQRKTLATGLGSCSQPTWAR
ncbi:MAG: PD40 domain-containing protein [Verrucomicrobiae bacterium]|nr:PD40 domain-containing protein [Verrucomicrobiae bacterium]MCP5521887.1 PD40 domain-containing protein [Verrucomicrobiales bacterium]